MVLCDINMPRMDGITLLGKIKENLSLLYERSWFPLMATWIIFRATMNHGAFDFVMKPINFEDLEKTIEKTVEEGLLLQKAQLAKTLEEKNTHLRQLDQLRTQFFTNISHEFRTPLTIITGMAGKIQENPQKWTQEGAKMIKRNGNNLLDLVNQILALRKLDAGKLTLNLKQADIVQYLNYITESFHSLAEQKDIKLTTNHLTAQQPMDYDEEKMLRIISNLLSNAIKFTPAGGSVQIQTTTSGQQFVIKIKDSGIGIPEEQLSQIFDRYHQVENAPMELPFEGSGIGLSLVKELIKLMEGTIDADSEVNAGTTFTLSLPITQNAPLKGNQPSPKDTSTLSQPLTTVTPSSSTYEADDQLPLLLIVEDHPEVAQYLVACLEGQYRLEFAKDGQEGIDKALAIIPDIIISDVMMPKKSGFELCNELKVNELTSHIPIVLLTAKADEDSQIEGLEQGADAFLPKPFNPKELHLKLNNLLSLRQKLREKYGEIANLPQKSANKEDEFITRIREEIESNLDDETFGITELSKAIGVSRAQMHRKITALTGKSTSKFIRSIRLFHARKLLLNSGLNISQVAYEVGFKDPKYFGRTFTEEYGQSPREVRQEIES